MTRLILFLFLILPISHLMAYDQAFSKTESGVFEIKELPAGRLLESKSNGSYFDSSNNLFRPLFNYIQKNDIAMTTPVEARMDPGAMYFWVAPDQVSKASENMARVQVIDVPKRTVAAIGSKGSYSIENFEKSKLALLNWIDENKDYEVVGEPFAVYWDGPFKPWFLKSYEVQVEVRVIPSGTKDLASK